MIGVMLGIGVCSEVFMHFGGRECKDICGEVIGIGFGLSTVRPSSGTVIKL